MKVELPMVATVTLYLLAALLVSVFAVWIARGLLTVGRLLPSQRAITVHRRQTLEGLIGSLISLDRKEFDLMLVEFLTVLREAANLRMSVFYPAAGPGAKLHGFDTQILKLYKWLRLMIPFLVNKRV